MTQNNSGIDIETFRMDGSCHADERGWVLFPWEMHKAPIDPATIHIVHILPGATRGNHYHPRSFEWLCPLEGDGLLLWRAGEGGKVEKLRLEARRLCVRIPPGVRHAVTNDGGKELLIVAAREKHEEGDSTVYDAV
jgi:oxalate decarboxylase/phosphoglucose isomerase-like protein (cupin superfamily)